MSFIDNHSLICPVDRLPLVRSESTLVCESGHSFDIARRGYVNLLLAGDKRSKDPGDSKAMVKARSDFLDGGHYVALADKLADIVGDLVGEGSTIVDAGCGEGYYLEHLQHRLIASGHSDVAFTGFDISKWAVQAASRRLSATWLVASNRNIPLGDSSADLVLSLFGFASYASFRRILKPGGKLIIVSAGPRHLMELREAIYPTVRLAGSTELARAQAAGFTLEDSTFVRYSTAPLTGTQINDLLSMTPHLYRAAREGVDRVLRLENIAINIDVELYVLG